MNDREPLSSESEDSKKQVDKALSKIDELHDDSDETPSPPVIKTDELAPSTLSPAKEKEETIKKKVRGGIGEIYEKFGKKS